MTDRLAGKTAIVTGAAQGIGEAAALLFAREGATVIALDRQTTDRFGGIVGVEFRVIDVTDGAALGRFCAAVDEVDVLFNCAGIVHEGTIFDCEESDWDLAFEVNVRPMYRLIRSLLPGMIRRGAGSVINMASVASSIRGVQDRFVYSTTKAAVIGMTKALAADFAGTGVRFNVICPGTVDTPSLRERIARTADPEAARNEFIARQPVGRLGMAEEIATLALYLASDESAYTTGTTQIIDGGWSN